MRGLLPPDLIRQLVTLAATYSIPIDELREYTLEAFTAGIRYVVTDQREWDVWPEVLDCAKHLRSAGLPE